MSRLLPSLGADALHISREDHSLSLSKNYILYPDASSGPVNKSQDKHRDCNMQHVFCFQYLSLFALVVKQGMVQDLTDALHNMSMHYVVIVDPGIKVDKGYSAYDQGLKDDIFVKDVTGNPYLGQVSFHPGENSLMPLICLSHHSFQAEKLLDLWRLARYLGTLTRLVGYSFKLPSPLAVQ